MPTPANIRSTPPQPNPQQRQSNRRKPTPIAQNHTILHPHSPTTMTARPSAPAPAHPNASRSGGSAPAAAPPAPTAAPSRLSTLPSQKARQLSHLHSQLAQLTAHVADLENLVRMTAVQAESVRGLGGYVGGLFMAGARVLGEETVREGKGRE